MNANAGMDIPLIVLEVIVQMLMNVIVHNLVFMVIAIIDKEDMNVGVLKIMN